MSRVHACTPPTRRDLLQVGFLGGLGLSLGTFLKLQSAQAKEGDKKPEPKAESVIHVYLQGGFPHMDSFDPKPDSPSEYRGPLGTQKTSVPGVLFGEHMVKTSQVADKMTVVRSMTHTEVDHTLYHLIGIDGKKDLMSPGNRPQPIVTGGKVVKALLA